MASVEGEQIVQKPAESYGHKEQPIARQKLSDQVFDRLWSMIVSGDLAPGDVIPSERNLMDRFQVGRPAVREAMQTLSHKGVIRIAQGERSRVNELTADTAVAQVDDIARLLLSTEPENLHHLKQLRGILEAASVGLAARTCRAEDAARLRDLIAAQRKVRSDARRFIQADVDFHEAIAKMSANPLLHVGIRAILTWLQEYYRPMLHWTDHEEITLLEHTTLVDHLEAGDTAGAVALVGAHLERSNPLFDAAPVGSEG